MKMDRPHVVVPPAKRRGRPPVGDEESNAPSADVHVTLPAAEYDVAFRLAKRQKVSIPELLRRGLKRLLKDERVANLET